MKRTYGILLVMILSWGTAYGATTHIEYALFNEIDKDKVEEEFHKQKRGLFFQTKLEVEASYTIDYDEKHFSIKWERSKDGKYKIDSSISDASRGDNFNGEVELKKSYLVVPFKKKTLVIRVVDWSN